MCEETNPTIVYHETIGGGDDNESGRRHGLVATLSYWHSNDWKAPNHYLLTKRVMIDRYIVVHEVEYIPSAFRRDSTQIRKAIFVVDQLMELNPEISEMLKVEAEA